MKNNVLDFEKILRMIKDSSFFERRYEITIPYQIKSLFIAFPQQNLLKYEKRHCKRVYIYNTRYISQQNLLLFLPFLNENTSFRGDKLTLTETIRLGKNPQKTWKKNLILLVCFFNIFKTKNENGSVLID